MDNRMDSRRLRAAVAALPLLLISATGYAQTTLPPRAVSGPSPSSSCATRSSWRLTTRSRVSTVRSASSGRWLHRTRARGRPLRGRCRLLARRRLGRRPAGGLVRADRKPDPLRRAGLIGGGNATLGADAGVRREAGGFNNRGHDPRLTRFGSAPRGRVVGTRPSTIRAYAQDEFFVFEPQVDLGIRLTDHVSVNWAAGYRLTALAEALDDRLNGATGSVALQLER